MMAYSNVALCIKKFKIEQKCIDPSKPIEKGRNNPQKKSEK